ncbi:MAG: PqqD family protein [Lachnotalea sp.]
MIIESKNCYPVITSNRNIMFQEKGDRFSINSHKLLRPIYLNRTSHEITEYCNGSRSISVIRDLMCNKYNEPAEKIEEDILKILYPLWKLKLVMFRGGKHPFNYHLKKQLCIDNEMYEFAVVRDTSTILDFVKSHENHYVNIHSYELDTLSKKQISVRFMYSEEIFFTLSHNNKITALVSISPQYTIHPFYDCLYYNMNNIFVIDNFLSTADKNALKFLFKWCCLWFGHEVNVLEPREFVNLYMAIDCQNRNEFIKVFNETDWKEVGLLKKEYKGEDASLLEHRIII